MKYIHPFPARMAPDLAMESIRKLKNRSIILDPMIGSGTVITEALRGGHTAIGYDLDPLAILLTKVATTPFDLEIFRDAGKDLLEIAQTRRISECALPWIDSDNETSDFLNYWFAQKQRNSLRKLAFTILSFQEEKRYPIIILNALKVALSRLIITKEMKASLARDTAHSRPHRVSLTNEFDVFDGFEKSISTMISILGKSFPLLQGKVKIFSGDARSMHKIEDASIDAIITSPPYLNAIDYLRGHKFSLVWLGYNLSDIRALREISVGTEKGSKISHDEEKLMVAITTSTNFEEHTPRFQKVINKYARDLDAVICEIRRVITIGGHATFVVGNSNIKGNYVDNANIVKAVAKQRGFQVKGDKVREIPQQRRYMPISKESSLGNRMKHESVITVVAI